MKTKLTDWALAALDVQDACNLTGVLNAYSELGTILWQRSNALNKGTNWVNCHPLSVLFADKIAQLAGVQNLGTEAFRKAYSWARKAAEVRDETLASWEYEPKVDPSKEEFLMLPVADVITFNSYEKVPAICPSCGCDLKDNLIHYEYQDQKRRDAVIMEDGSIGWDGGGVPEGLDSFIPIEWQCNSCDHVLATSRLSSYDMTEKDAAKVYDAAIDSIRIILMES